MRSLALMAAILAVTFFAPAFAQASIKIEASGLEPDFRTGQSDYVISPERCGNGRATAFDVTATRGSRARIGLGKGFRGRSRVRNAFLADGQAIYFTLVKRNGTRKVFSARCLPDDFAEYSFSRYGATQSGLFAIDPFNGDATSTNYSIIFSDAGAPVWWRRVEPISIDTKVLPGGLISWANYYGGGFGQNEGVRYELRRPDGSLEQTFRTVGAPTDHHDLQPTSDGNWLILSYVPRAQLRDASAFNGDSEAQIIDAVIQKLSPTGELLWQWDGSSHIALAETGRWWSGLEEPYDIHHINSVEEVTDGSGDLLISLRHTDAVYRIDGDSGQVVWKLGGTPTPESLEISGDPLGAYPFGGQHDARWLGGGEITVFDNGTNLDRGPRAVSYRIDEAAGEAVLLNAVSDPDVSRSRCCGSARRLPGGNWLISSGGANQVSELTQGGDVMMRLSFAADLFSYRAQPVGDAITVDGLRTGMDAQVPPLP